MEFFELTLSVNLNDREYVLGLRLPIDLQQLAGGFLLDVVLLSLLDPNKTS